MTSFWNMDINMQRWYAEQGIPPSMRQETRLTPGANTPIRRTIIAGLPEDPDADPSQPQAYLLRDKPGMLVYTATFENPNVNRSLISRFFQSMLQSMSGGR